MKSQSHGPTQSQNLRLIHTQNPRFADSQSPRMGQVGKNHSEASAQPPPTSQLKQFHPGAHGTGGCINGS